MTDQRDPQPGDAPVREHTTVIERRGSGATPVLLVLVLIALGAIAYFVFVGNEREAAKDGAITDAATAVEGAAKDVGDAARKAVD